MNTTIECFKDINVAITICDLDGIIIYMNQKAKLTFEKYGGEKLVGESLYNCHNPKSVEAIHNLMINNKTNTYTIEKNGIKKLIHQTPWYQGEIVKGLIEYSLEIAFEMPHFIRS